MKKLKVALLQTDIAWHDITANLKHAGSLIPLIPPGTSLIVLPEMFNTGFTMRPAALAEDMDSETVGTMKKWSSTTGADVTGSIIVKENGSFFNRLVWISPEGKVLTYNKRHLFRIADEDRVYTAGNINVTAERDGWRIKPFICYDLRFPLWIRNTPVHYDVLVFTANWPASRQNQWEALIRARAIENQCYAIGVNRTGIDGGGMMYQGGSVVFDFRGDIVVQAGDDEQMLQCTLDYEPLAEYRESYPFWMDADSFTFP